MVEYKQQQSKLKYEDKIFFSRLWFVSVGGSRGRWISECLLDSLRMYESLMEGVSCIQMTALMHHRKLV